MLLQSRIVLKKWLFRVPIYYRILIANSAVIIVGAVGGTFLARTFAQSNYSYSVMIIFGVLGIVFSVLFNSWIVRTALQPLYQLRIAVNRINGKAINIAERFGDTDPDIHLLARTIDELLTRLHQRSEQFARLSKQVVYMQEEERKRIARELHDDLGQALSLLTINLERMENEYPDIPLEVRQKLTFLREITTNSVKDLRYLIYGLRPTMLDDLGLIPAIRWYARNTLDMPGTEIEIEADENQVNALPDMLKTCLYRITQEAISNIKRHAQATHVSISIETNDHEVHLAIKDNGRGFSSEDLDQNEDLKLGLLGIRERVLLIGGEITINATPGEGTEILIYAPLECLLAQ